MAVDALQAQHRVFQSIGIEDCALLSPEEAQRRCPILSTEGILGAMWADREGYIDTTGTVHAYAGAAKKRGATVIEHNRVLELHQRPGGGWDVVTEKGTIKKTELAAYSNPRAGGIIAINLTPDDELVCVRLAEPEQDTFLLVLRRICPDTS